MFAGVLAPDGQLKLSFSNLYLYSALASGAAAVLSRSLLVTIAVGVATAIVLRQLSG